MATKTNPQLTPEQIRLYRDHFEVFDLNGDGVISAKELYKVSKQLGYRLTEEQIMVRVVQGVQTARFSELWFILLTKKWHFLT